MSEWETCCCETCGAPAYRRIVGGEHRGDTAFHEYRYAGAVTVEQGWKAIMLLGAAFGKLSERDDLNETELALLEEIIEFHESIKKAPDDG